MTLLRHIIIISFLSLLAINTRGQTFSWSGSTNGKWLTATNWSGGVSPNVITAEAFFNIDTSAGNNELNLDTILMSQSSIGAIHWGSNASVARTIYNSAVSATGALKLNGITLGSVPNVIIRNASSGDHIITNGSQNLDLVLNDTTTNTILIDSTGNITIVSKIEDGLGSKLTKAGLGAGVLILSGANTYSKGTVITSGTLRLGASGVLSDTGTVVLNGGILSSGSGVGFIETMGTLKLSANSSIALATGIHTLTFANSSGLSWVGSSTLTITGWSGSPGSSGSAGKIVLGSAGLTSTQLKQIAFAGYNSGNPGATIVSGEVVPCANVIPSVTIAISSGVNPSCYGASVIFTATPTNGGTPTYQWKKDTVNVGTNIPTYIDNGTTGGTITCMMTSSLECITNLTATSGGISLVINQAPSFATNNSTTTICNTTSTILSGNNPSIGVGSWSVVSGPSTSLSQFDSISNPTATFTPVGGVGGYVVVWTISNAPCTANSASGTITVVAFTNTWTGTVNNNWNAAGNWACGVTPNSATADVMIPDGKSPILDSTNTSIRNLTMLGNSSLGISNKTLTLHGSFTGSNTAGLLGSASSNLTVNGNVGSIRFVSATLNNFTINTASNAILSENLNISGNMSVSGTIDATNTFIGGTGSFTLNSSGRIKTSHSEGITLSGAVGSIQTLSRNYNSGAIYEYNAGGNQNTGAGLPTPLAGSVIISNNSNVTISNHLTLNGSSNSVSAGSNLNIQANFNFINNGQIAGDATVINSVNAVYSGNGTLNAELTNHGTIAPGNSIGTIFIKGKYKATPSSIHNIEIASLTSFDKIVVDGEAILDGTLNIILLGSYVPNNGDSFKFLTATKGVSGTFATSNFPAGYSWSLTYNSNDVTLNFLGALPVELIGFNAAKRNKEVALDWSTASEQDNDFFAIERSNNGNDYYEIGQVEGKGTTLLTSRYIFMDKTPTSGDNYYRLRQVDFNAEFAYSPVRVVRMEQGNSYQVFPTLVSNTLTVRASDISEEDLQLSIISTINGQLISIQTMIAGNTQSEINTESLPQGSYMLQLTKRNEVKHFMFIKQ